MKMHIHIAAIYEAASWTVLNIQVMERVEARMEEE